MSIQPSISRTRELQLYEKFGTTRFVRLKAPDVPVSTYTLTLPSSGPTGTKILQTDANGNMSFADPANAAIPSELVADSLTGTSDIIVKPAAGAGNDLLLRDSTDTNRVSIASNGDVSVTTGTGRLLYNTREVINEVKATSGHISVSASGPSVTLSLPQPVGPTNSPTFVAVNAPTLQSSTALTVQTTASNANINLVPNGTGKVLYKGNEVVTTTTLPSSVSVTSANANRVTVTPVGSNFILSTPQDQHTAANVTYATLTLSGALTANTIQAAALNSMALGVQSSQTLNLRQGNVNRISLASTGAVEITPNAGEDVELKTTLGGSVLVNGVEVVTLINGTPNRITVSRSGTTYTLSGPQDLHTGGTPTFLGVTLGSSGLTSNVVQPVLSNALSLRQSGGIERIQLAVDGSISATAAINRNVTLNTSGTGKVLYNGSEVLTVASSPVSTVVQGTTNQVTASLSGNTYTLTLPQDVHAGANMTLNTLLLSTGNLTSASGLVMTAASGNVIVLKQASSNRIFVSSVGAIVMTPDGGRDMTVTTSLGGRLLYNGDEVARKNNTEAANFGSVSAFTGVYSSPTNLIIESSAVGSITLRQSTNGRIGVSSAGAITLSPATNTNISLNTTGSGKVLYNGSEVLTTTYSPPTTTVSDPSGRLTVTPVVGGYTVSTTQDLRSSASPTFTALTLSGATGLAFGGDAIVASGTSGDELTLKQGPSDRIKINTGGAVVVTPEAGQDINLQTSSGGKLYMNGAEVVTTGSFSPTFGTVSVSGTITGTGNLVAKPATGAGNVLRLQDQAGNNRVVVSTAATEIFNDTGDLMATFGSSGTPGIIELRSRNGADVFMEVGGGGDIWLNTQDAGGVLRFSSMGVDKAVVNAAGNMTLAGNLTIGSAVGNHVPTTITGYEEATFSASATGPIPIGTPVTVTFRLFRMGNLVHLYLPAFSVDSSTAGAGFINFSARIPPRFVPKQTMGTQSPALSLNDHLVIFSVQAIDANSLVDAVFQVGTSSDPTEGARGVMVLKRSGNNFFNNGSKIYVGMVNTVVSWYTDAPFNATSY